MRKFARKFACQALASWAAFGLLACASPSSPAKPEPQRSMSYMARGKAKSKGYQDFMWHGWGPQGARVPPEWTGRPKEDPESKRKREQGVADVDRPSWHTAKMTALEAELIAEINRLRQDPAGYIKRLERFRGFYKGRIVRPPGNLAIQTEEGPAAVGEAMAALNDLPPRKPLARSPALDRAALVHAIDLRQTSELSHIGRDGSRVADRMSRFGDLEGAFAEMISAGFRDPELILMQWLVDDGVVTRANRVHTLASLFGNVGVACAPHKGYLVVCVATLVGSIEAYKIRPPDAVGRTKL